VAFCVQWFSRTNVLKICACADLHAMGNELFLIEEEIIVFFF
jgi:hypothetical protein